MTVVAVELLQSRKRGHDPLEWIARKVEVKRMFQRRISLMRGKDLDITPGETDEVRLELGRSIADCTTPLGVGKEGQIENALPHIRPAAVNKISEIGHTDGIDLLAGKENIKNRIHVVNYLSAFSHQLERLKADNILAISLPHGLPQSRRTDCDR